MFEIIKINDVSVIGTVIIDGIKYYIDTNKAIYEKTNNEHVIVSDEERLRKIIDYISPKSLDVIHSTEE